MTTLHELFLLLRGIRSLQFEAKSESTTTTGWNGVGSGSVVVSEPSTNVVVFTESGKWQPTSSEKSIDFNNVFRWSIFHDALRLEHLRLGPDQPVHLFDMTAGGEGEWREITPHHCRQDCYHATLEVINGQLLMAWSVVGPQKRESIRYLYC